MKDALPLHPVKCPTCGTCVEVDFVPVAGQVWCPTCQKLFSPRSAAQDQPSGTEEVDPHKSQNGGAD